MARTRIAIIGLGMAVEPHAGSLIDLSERVEVVCGYSRTQARREAFALKYAMPVSDNLNAIFADASIDAVMILTPPNSHRELVERAAETGKHVLLEKPLDISTPHAEKLVEAAERAGVKLAVVLQHRFRPTSQALAALLAHSRLGEMVGVSARLYNWRPQSYYDVPGRGTRARDGGGVLLTQGIHTIDLLLSLTGLPHEVFAYATTSPVHRMETEDMVVCALRYPCGAMGTVTATTCAFPGFADRIDLIGTLGTAILDGPTLTAKFHDGTELVASDSGPGGGAGADPMAFPHDHHRAVLADFLDSIDADRAPRVCGRTALKAHDFIDALLHSAEKGIIAKVKTRER
ncbi:Gfo/Idh/MocA family oxidoreductase (plasmid) [Phyllobacterium sp. A18/5-2]|uniref:Gfo/Idh/MocA family protein n=1 Tax=Phyllobacterium sp. A18/5-2 TaxID=2978392 RepID=UPI0021C59F3C|nr:Gfo/Idh/MocA family oxidoreductase [Phyllobacterium sp. A18/5-2]UXN66720.1 Gfo/Idh/MocA family oxidoreductase [Phyllobacterium sp. A18/5-2]